MPLKKIQKYTKKLLLILFLTFSFLCISAQQQLAFPTAMGAGAYSTGGRGGEVVHVTNLNDSGVGSFRWALTDASNKGVSRTIVFDVSGVIELQSNIYASNGPGDEGGYADGITIAGQTAPEGGITITGGKIFLIAIDDVVIRYVKFRSTTNVSGCLQSQDANNVIFDHLSGSHVESAEVTFSMVSNNENIEASGKTIQNCLIYDSGLGFIIGDTTPPNDSHNEEYTIINNLFVNVGHRSPGKIGGAVRLDIINNTVHNWFARLIRLDDWSYTLNHIGNYYSTGGRSTQLANTAYFGTNNGAIYDNDNYLDSNFTGYEWTDFSQPRVDPLPESSFVSTAFNFNNSETLNIRTSLDLKTEVLPYVGSYKYINDNGVVIEDRDIIDSSAINKALTEFQGDTSEDVTYDITIPEIPTSYNTRPSSFYQSNPNIPEAYLVNRGIEGSVTIHNQIQPSGYTLLEEYLNGVDNDVSAVAIGVESIAVTPSTAELIITDSLQLTATFTPSNATNQEGTWTSGDEDIAIVDANGLVTPISIGEVTITFTTDDGDFTDTSEITVFPEALDPSAGVDQQICEGESTTLTASGGTSYVWSTGETSESIEVTPEETTSFIVTVSDDFEQSEDVSVTVTVNPIPAANAGEDQSICEGSSTILTATGGTSYLWSTGDTTASIEVSPTYETTYSVEVSNDYCSSSDDVTIYVNTAPEILISENIVIMEGESTTLTVSGGETYAWSTGETTESISVNPINTTTYSVSANGPNGCLNSAEVTVTVIPELIAIAGGDESICSGETITLSASGGSNYIWNTGYLGSELTVSPTETTTYTVTVENEFGYSDTDDVTVFVNDLPNISINEDLFVLNGNSVTLTATGGNTYSWSTGESTSEITVSPDVTTTYTVTGFSEAGCQSVAEVVVTVVEDLVANAGNDITICLGESVTLNASGGITYTWSTGDTGATQTFSPTETTTYTVTVTDGFGNSDTDDVTITVNSLPIAFAGEDKTICQGESVELVAEGGDSYLWSTGETTTAINVNPNEDTIYTVEVFANDCSATDDVAVFVMAAPELIVSDAMTIVSGSSTIIEASGADSYVWSTGETTSAVEVNPIETTTYSVTGFSFNSCQITKEITVTVIAEVLADAGDDVSICSGESVTLIASGGPEFFWDTGDTSASVTVSPIETTTYTVTVTDNFGNSDTDSVIVTVNDLPSLTLSEDVTITEGEIVNLAASGAETYQWSTGDTSSTISVSPIETTIYTVTGYSVTGCEVTEQVTVSVVVDVIADAGNDVSICNGENVTLTAIGGGDYTWNTG
ncbi:Ig-like domain-containing protein, partial [Winogradskyella psychrotolerans]|uniref:Ig-like domain-containing protein n=1 Tax=Winogradskyella psychrotolerans TaxID=1344585 RepID=UPI001C0689C1